LGFCGEGADGVKTTDGGQSETSLDKTGFGRGKNRPGTAALKKRLEKKKDAEGVYRGGGDGLIFTKIKEGHPPR